MGKAKKIDFKITIDSKDSTQSFNQESIMIGSGDTANLRLEASGVSGVHAIIKVTAKKVSIQDLGSTNGTYVKGAKITQETAIAEGEEIGIGKAKLTFKSAAAEATPDTTQVVRDRDKKKPRAQEGAQAKGPAPKAELPKIENEDSTDTQRITFELAKVETDSYGIPTFLFKEELKTGEQPTTDNKILQVNLLWRESIISVSHFGKAKPITIGDTPKCTYRIAGQNFSPDPFVFLDTDGYGFVLRLPENYPLEVKSEDGQIKDLKKLLEIGTVKKDVSGPSPVYSYHIGVKDKLAVQIGELTFMMQYVSPARWIKTGIARTVDFYFSKVVAISLLVHLFVILSMLFTPIMPFGLDNDLFQNPDRFASLTLKPPQIKKTKKDFELEKKIQKEKNNIEKFGQVVEKKEVIVGKQKVDIDKRELDKKKVEKSGIFSALKINSGAASIFAAGGLGVGITNAINTLQGAAADDAGGVGGMGSRGLGGAFGGGGLGIGGLGTGSGDGGMSNVGLAGRGKKGYSVVPGKTIIEGGLSKEEVGRVLERAHNQVRYCYEKELGRNPNLYGKITTEFTIGPTGRVISSVVANTTMNDSNVEQCILRVINRLVFPQPKGGGIVKVNYPWIFKRSGGE